MQCHDRASTSGRTAIETSDAFHQMHNDESEEKCEAHADRRKIRTRSPSDSRMDVRNHPGPSARMVFYTLKHRFKDAIVKHTEKGQRKGCER